MIKTREEYKHIQKNRTEIEQSANCACCYCLQKFTASRIMFWIEQEQTALCPECGCDAVIGDASGIDLTDELLQKIQKEWF